MKKTSTLLKIIHLILFITTATYIIESMFLRGLFTNTLLACINIILSISVCIVSILKKHYKLAIIDCIIFTITLLVFIFVTNS